MINDGDKEVKEGFDGDDYEDGSAAVLKESKQVEEDNFGEGAPRSNIAVNERVEAVDGNNHVTEKDPKNPIKTQNIDKGQNRKNSDIDDGFEDLSPQKTTKGSRRGSALHEMILNTEQPLNASNRSRRGSGLHEQILNTEQPLKVSSRAISLESLKNEAQKPPKTPKTPKSQKGGRKRPNIVKYLYEALKDFLDDQFVDRKLFTLKFLIHELSDITQDIGVFSLVYITNYILPRFRDTKFAFPTTFDTQISIWTALELCLDLFFFFVCLNLFKKFFFVKGGKVNEIFQSFLSHYRTVLFVSILLLFFLCFYIVYFVVIGEP